MKKGFIKGEALRLLRTYSPYSHNISFSPCSLHFRPDLNNLLHNKYFFYQYFYFFSLSLYYSITYTFIIVTILRVSTSISTLLLGSSLFFESLLAIQQTFSNPWKRLVQTNTIFLNSQVLQYHFHTGI